MTNHKGHPLCNYCGIPSHPRATCKIKIRDVENGVKRDTHPARGTGNQMWRDAKTKLAELTRKRSHTGQEGPHNTKTRPSPTHRANYNIHITMDDNQLPSTSTMSCNGKLKNTEMSSKYFFPSETVFCIVIVENLHHFC